MNGLIGLIARRPGTVALVLLVATAVALIPASRLHLATDLPSLLPDNSPAAQAYRVFLDQFGAAERIFITIEGTRESDVITGGLLGESASRIAEKLEAHPEVASARAGLEAEDEASFFAEIIERAPLFLEDHWRNDIQRRLEPRYIRERVALIRSAALTPSGAVRTTIFEHDPLGFSDDLNVAALSDFGLSIDPTTLVFLSPDHGKALIIVEPAASELDPEAGRTLEAIIDQTVADTASEMNLSLAADAVGGPLFAAHDEAVIRTDLQRTLPITALACSLLLAAAFAGVGIPVAGLVALGAAMVWLAAGLSLTRGSASMIVVGFAAVLIGLGIDAAIHGGAALRRHTLAGLPRPEAALKTVKEVGPAVLTASVTTAAAFGVLAFSVLPPLRELGVVIAFGMATIIIATATLGLALALLLYRFHGRAGTVWTIIGQLVDSVVSLAEAWPRTVVILAALATVAAGTQIVHIEVRPDLSRLRPVNHPIVEAGRRLASTFGIGGDTATLLITGDTLDQTLERAHNAREILEATDPNITILSPDQRLRGPRAISERLREIRALPLKQASTLLQTELSSAGLNLEAFSPGLSALEAFAEGRDPKGDRDGLDDQLRRTNGGRTMAGLAIRLPEGLWPEGPPAFIREAVDKVAPDALFASMPWVGADLRRLASRDLRRLSGLSLALILIVVGFSFRGRPTPTVLALCPVVLGTIWAFGIWGAMGRHLDLFGLAILPVMLGLGIDDGLYSIHGAGRRGVTNIGPSIRNSGRAMVLTTLTTALAFGSLGMSHLPALRAAALLVPLAVIACLAATLVVLPAIAALVAGPEFPEVTK